MTGRKANKKKELSPLSLWRFRSALSLPQTTWLLCEDGEARILKPADTMQFLTQASNVLGWKDGR